jgi:hypothetical protein
MTRSKKFIETVETLEIEKVYAARDQRSEAFAKSRSRYGTFRFEFQNGKFTKLGFMKHKCEKFGTPYCKKYKLQFF